MMINYIRFTPMALKNGISTIYVGSEDGRLYAINPNGSEKWSFDSGDHVSSSPSIGPDGTIYFGNEGSQFYAIGDSTLNVNITAAIPTVNSAAQSAVVSHVTDGTNPVQDAIVNLTVDCGGLLVPQNGTTDANGDFTSIFNAPTMTTQMICRITAEANRTGYENGTGYIDIVVNPIPWPKFRHNLQNTGLSPHDTSKNPGKLKWYFTTGHMVHSSPTVGFNDTIYVGSIDGKLYAINMNGTEKWNFSSGIISYSSPTIGSDGTIYVGSRDHKLYAVNPDGIQKWNFTTGWDIAFSSAAIGSDGTVYIGSTDKRLYAINPNGTEKWNFTVGHFVETTPAIAIDGTIYFGSIDHNLYALYPNGTLKWIFSTGNSIDSSPAIDKDGIIYFGSGDKKLYAVYPSGAEKWNFPTNGGITSSPAIGADGMIYFATSSAADHKLYAVYPNGTQKWTFSDEQHMVSSPAIGSDGCIYIGSADHRLYAINPDGSQRWNFTAGNWITSSPAIGSDGTIYVGSQDHRLYAIGINATANMPPEPRHLGVQNFLEGTIGIVHITDHTPNLNWTYFDANGDTQTQFEVRVGSSAGLNDLWSTGIQTGDTTGITYAGAQLIDGTDYWFGVRVFDGEDWSLWNETQFHMNAIFAPREPVIPANASTISASVTQNVSWTSGGADPEGDAVVFHWEISMDSSFSIILSSGDGTATISGQFATTPSTTYYWRVYADDGWETSEYGNEPLGYWTFMTTEAQTEPPPPVDFNYKPVIALIFSIVLGLFGALLAFKRPLKFEVESRRKLYTWLALVLPYMTAEAFTGLISYFTGFLSVPPLLGLGMIVDMIILLSGIIVFVLMLIRRKQESLPLEA
jgi:outer membrane protein assembly factor BamB